MRNLKLGKLSGLNSFKTSADKPTVGGSSFSTLTKRSQLYAVPEFEPINEDEEPQEFIKGFEKFTEDVAEFIVNTDEKFSSRA